MDIVLCFNEYNEFRYLLTIRTHIDELFSHLNTDSLLYQIYGGYNLMKILNMNDIINIGEQCKNKHLCYIYLKTLCLCKNANSFTKHKRRNIRNDFGTDYTCPQLYTPNVTQKHNYTI
jgi:hypothetical protein